MMILRSWVEIRMSRSITITCGAFLCSLAMSSAILTGAETTKPETKSVVALPLIVAHRGASYDAPENTLAAFELAWRQGADVIEGDFYLTADNEIVCLHDKTTDRTAPKQSSYIPSQATLEQLRKLDVGAWKNAKFAGEKIPTLEEVLATVPVGKKIFVEIKCGVEILPELKKQLAASGLQREQIVLICFDTEVVTQARKMMGDYQANWLTAYRRDPDTRTLTPTTSAILETLQNTAASGLGTKDEMAAINEDLVSKIRAMGLGVHAWTVDDPVKARSLQELGFDSITTNQPAKIRAALMQPPK